MFWYVSNSLSEFEPGYSSHKLICSICGNVKARLVTDLIKVCCVNVDSGRE
jgi:hypothetical protein